MQRKGSQKEFVEFDAWAFTRTGGSISSAEVKFDFPRIASDELIAKCDVSHWEVSGRINAQSESVLRFKGHFSVEMPCVVCSESVLYSIDFERHLVLQTSEAQADAYDEDTLDDHTDVVACPGAINLRDWLEDEILLACPMFPKHEGCADVAGRTWLDNDAPEDTDDYQDDTADGSISEVQRPFANLSDLLKTGKK